MSSLRAKAAPVTKLRVDLEKSALAKPKDEHPIGCRNAKLFLRHFIFRMKRRTIEMLRRKPDTDAGFRCQ